MNSGCFRTNFAFCNQFSHVFDWNPRLYAAQLKISSSFRIRIPLSQTVPYFKHSKMRYTFRSAFCAFSKDNLFKSWLFHYYWNYCWRNQQYFCFVFPHFKRVFIRHSALRSACFWKIPSQTSYHLAMDDSGFWFWPISRKNKKGRSVRHEWVEEVNTTRSTHAPHTLSLTV